MQEKTGITINRRQFITGAIFGSVFLSTDLLSAFAASPIGLPPLPYPENALAPYVSARTISFHYGKHHQTYVNNTSKLIKNTELDGKPLEEIIKATAGNKQKTAIFNNAAQVWNHTFYWKSMKPKGGGLPTGRLAEKIKDSFGSFTDFKKVFIIEANSLFGSGWCWLVLDGNNLKITKTSNADNPLIAGQKPLLTIDLWEHAYYLDYQNRRSDYTEAFFNYLVNWDFALENLTKD